MNNRYDEAMQCHHNAAELLLDAMKSTASSVALESITLQHSYHLKQKDLIKSKKDQYARVKKAMDNLKCIGKDPGLNLQGNDYTKLQVAIYRAINETDSLLHTLMNKKDEPGLLVAAASKDVDGKRTEKTKEVVVEELQILSQNLHSLIEQLVMQVEVLKDDNSTLKERVLYLEKERLKYLNLPSAQNELPNRNFDDFPVLESEPKVSQSRPTNAAAAMERPSQHTHFDLSAFRDN